MSTSKHVDQICIAVISLVVIITLLFMNGEKLGITVIHRVEAENTSEMFTANDRDADWDATGAAKIVLNGDSAEITGNGAYFSKDTLHIAFAGKYVISGTLDGSIQIDADGDDKIWLLFDGVDITSKTDAPLFIKQAGKVFLTLNEDSQNTLTYEKEEEDADIDGSIFSRDDLTINGTGELTIVSSGLHGIVCNDSLVFAGGKISITAKQDAVHAHDAIKICDTSLTVTAGDDGLHAGNDEENSIFYMESGYINITECYEGIEANEITIAGGTVDILPRDDGINANGRGASAVLTISGGDITVINPNGRDADGLDSNGSIRITGGNVFISLSGNGTNNAIDFGSENGGKCTISGGTVIACGSSQMAEAPDSDSPQGFLMQMVTGKENDQVSVLDSGGEEIISKEIPCSFTSVLISSPELNIGDTVKLKVGTGETELTISNVTENRMGGFGNRDGFAPGGEGFPEGQRPFGRNGSSNMSPGEEGFPEGQRPFGEDDSNMTTGEEGFPEGQPPFGRDGSNMPPGGEDFPDGQRPFGRDGSNMPPGGEDFPDGHHPSGEDDSNMLPGEKPRN